MIRCIRSVALAMLALALVAGCASTPVNYYTLIPSSDARTDSRVTRLFAFDLAAVGVPAQVDQPQLVVRQNGAGIALIESERWIAPLADEVRGALASELVSRHGADDLSGLPQSGRDVIRIKVDVQRLDSQPGQFALLEASWSLRRGAGDQAQTLSCRSRFQQSVAAGYDALVRGHQRALAELAQALATTAAAISKGSKPSCP